jgi:hypothetical protein
VGDVNRGGVGEKFSLTADRNGGSVPVHKLEDDSFGHWSSGMADDIHVVRYDAWRIQAEVIVRSSCVDYSILTLILLRLHDNESGKIRRCICRPC